MLKENINTDYITAFKAGDTVKKNVLSVLKGEIQTLEKNMGVASLSDEDVIKILNKSVKSLKETLAYFPDNEVTQFELAVIESYLPKQLTTEEIREIVKTLAEAGMSSIGEFMRHFKDMPADRQVVADTVKELLNKK